MKLFISKSATRRPLRIPRPAFVLNAITPAQVAANKLRTKELQAKRIEAAKKLKGPATGTIAADGRKVIQFTPRKEHSINSLPVSTVTLKTFSPMMYCPVDSHALLVKLSKVGIHSPVELIKSVNTFAKTAKDRELAAVVDPTNSKTVLDALVAAFELRIKVSTLARYYNHARRPPKPALVKQYKEVAKELQTAYSYIAVKLCAVLQLPVTNVNAICFWLMFGKGTVPKEVKAMLSASALKAIEKNKVDLPDLSILEVKPLHIRKFGHELVNKLSSMYSAYVDSLNKKEARLPPLSSVTDPKKKEALRKKIIQRRRDNANGNTARAKANALEKVRETAATNIFAAVGQEVYDFYQLVIPNFVPIITAEHKELKKTVNDCARRVREYRFRGVTRIRGKLVKTDARKTISQNMKEASEALKAYELTVKPIAKSWMVAYIPSTVEINAATGRKVRIASDDGILIHRLVERANSGKLKDKDVELSAILDTTNASLLTIVGVDNILDVLGSVAAFKTVFRNCMDIVKVKAFSIAMSEQFGNGLGLDTEFGKVTDTRLLKLNSIKKEDEDAYHVQYKDEIAAWNPLKVLPSELAAKVGKSPKAAVSKYKATAATPLQLATWQAELPERMSGLHNVKLTLVKAWVLDTPPMLKALLKNTAKSKELHVIRDCYHGTSEQAGSVILHCGFKIKGTQVTARSMGDVLYIAPNVDKSAQYLKKGGGFTHHSTGIIFVGDIIVSGAPSGAASKAKSEFSWTKTNRFKTEEIGLINPNKQFIIRRAYLIRVTSDKIKSRGKSVSARSKFKPMLTMSAYHDAHVNVRASAGAVPAKPVKP